MTAAAVVDVDVIGAGELDIRGHEHGGDPRDGVGEKVVLREPEAGDRDDEALDAPLEHEPEVSALVVLRPLLDAADDQEVAALSRLRLGAGDCLGEEVIAHIRRDHSERVGALRR